MTTSNYAERLAKALEFLLIPKFMHLFGLHTIHPWWDTCIFCGWSPMHDYPTSSSSL